MPRAAPVISTVRPVNPPIASSRCRSLPARPLLPQSGARAPALVAGTGDERYCKSWILISTGGLPGPGGDPHLSLCCERIHHPQAVEVPAVLEVFGEEARASRRQRCLDDQPVPERDAGRNGPCRCGEDEGHIDDDDGMSREGAEMLSCLARRKGRTQLARGVPVELLEDLGAHHEIPGLRPAEDPPSRLALLRLAHVEQVEQEVGVEEGPTWHAFARARRPRPGRSARP